jgi:meso-butanediol dehydrogenase / (S,S)-butanediol dehydrogenase / diacetyl reductase
MVSRFEGKVVIIARAATEIGAATARRLHAEGASVVLSGDSEARLAEVADSLGSDRYLVKAVDATVAKDVEKLVAEAALRFGAIDVLVNIARPISIANFLNQSYDEWHKIFLASMDGMLNMTRATMPRMVGVNRGAIVNVSSAGEPGEGGFEVHDLAKGVACDLTSSLAVEFARKGIRTNSVCPGITLADTNAPIFRRDPELLRQQIERNPMGRVAEPDEVAGAIAFLASDDASFVNGVNLHVDGGGRILNDLI